MKIIEYPNQTELVKALKRPVFDLSKLEKSVKRIINQVIKQGDKAIINLTKKFDKVEMSNLRISKSVIDNSEQVS